MTGLGFVVDAERRGSLPACLTDEERCACPKTKSRCRRIWARRIARHLLPPRRRGLTRPVPRARQAPLLDRKPPAKMCPRYAGLLPTAGEGPVKPVAGSERIGPSTARKGNPQVAPVACLVPAGDPSLLQTVERSIRAGR